MPGTRPGMAGKKLEIRKLPNGWEAPAHGRELARFDERRGAKIDIVDIGENTHDRDHRGAHKADDHDLQVGAAVRATHRVVHSILPVFRRDLGRRVIKCIRRYKYVSAITSEPLFTEP
jgi:hypothetical protein